MTYAAGSVVVITVVARASTVPSGKVAVWSAPNVAPLCSRARRRLRPSSSHRLPSDRSTAPAARSARRASGCPRRGWRGRGADRSREKPPRTDAADNDLATTSGHPSLNPLRPERVDRLSVERELSRVRCSACRLPRLGQSLLVVSFLSIASSRLSRSIAGTSRSARCSHAEQIASFDQGRPTLKHATAKLPPQVVKVQVDRAIGGLDSGDKMIACPFTQFGV